MPPVCSNAFSTTLYTDVTRAASGTDGLGIIYTMRDSPSYNVNFFSTDMLGTAVTTDQLITSRLERRTGLVGLAYGMSEFGVLFLDWRDDWLFQRLAP